jgi:hypothetical protein
MDTSGFSSCKIFIVLWLTGPFFWDMTLRHWDQILLDMTLRHLVLVTLDMTLSLGPRTTGNDTASLGPSTSVHDAASLGPGTTGYDAASLAPSTTGYDASLGPCTSGHDAASVGPGTTGHLKMKAARFFKTSGTACPVTQHRVLHERFSQVILFTNFVITSHMPASFLRHMNLVSSHPVL